MASLEEIKNLLLSNNSEIKKDITEAKNEVMSGLKKDIEEAKTEVLSTVNSLLQTHLEKIHNLEEKVDNLEEIDRQRYEKELQREVMDKKHNIIIHKVEENEPSAEALHIAMVKLLSEITGQIIELRDIDSMYRLGKKESNKRRPILIRFVSLLNKEMALKKWKLFSERNMDISEDFPAEIRRRRKIILPTLKELKGKGLKASLRVDKLVVNGEIWSIERAKEVIGSRIQQPSDPTNSTSNKRDRSPNDSSPSKLNSSKKPQLKLSLNKTSGIREFFQTSGSPKSKSPAVIHTPHKNEQVTTIVSDS